MRLLSFILVMGICFLDHFLFFCIFCLLFHLIILNGSMLEFEFFLKKFVSHNWKSIEKWSTWTRSAWIINIFYILIYSKKNMYSLDRKYPKIFIGKKLKLQKKQIYTKRRQEQISRACNFRFNFQIWLKRRNFQNRFDMIDSK